MTQRTFTNTELQALGAAMATIAARHRVAGLNGPEAQHDMTELLADLAIAVPDDATVEQAMDLVTETWTMVIAGMMRAVAVLSEGIASFLPPEEYISALTREIYLE